MAKPKKKSELIERTAKAAALRHKAEGEAALAQIERRISTISEAFYDVGLALKVLRRQEVYVALGAGSFAELVETRTQLSRTVAFELLRVVDRLTRDTAIELGAKKAGSLIALVDATSAPDDAETLARTDAKVGGTRISKLSANALRAAARKKKRPPAGGSPEADEAGATASAISAYLRARGVDASEVTTAKRRDGWRVRIELTVADAKRLRWTARAKAKP